MHFLLGWCIKHSPSYLIFSIFRQSIFGMRKPSLRRASATVALEQRVYKLITATYSFMYQNTTCPSCETSLTANCEEEMENFLFERPGNAVLEWHIYLYIYKMLRKSTNCFLCDQLQDTVKRQFNRCTAQFSTIPFTSALYQRHTCFPASGLWSEPKSSPILKRNQTTILETLKEMA